MIISLVTRLVRNKVLRDGGGYGFFFSSGVERGKIEELFVCFLVKRERKREDERGREIGREGESEVERKDGREGKKD
jgi:hypothetical protein